MCFICNILSKGNPQDDKNSKIENIENRVKKLEAEKYFTDEFNKNHVKITACNMRTMAMQDLFFKEKIIVDNKHYHNTGVIADCKVVNNISYYGSETLILDKENAIELANYIYKKFNCKQTLISPDNENEVESLSDNNDIMKGLY